MDWNYLFFVNLIFATGLLVMHLTRDNVPWYLSAILCLNFLLLIISSAMNGEKDRERDKRIEQLEKELDELRQK